jgi:hypothetical protein
MDTSPQEFQNTIAGFLSSDLFSRLPAGNKMGGGYHAAVEGADFRIFRKNGNCYIQSRESFDL